MRRLLPVIYVMLLATGALAQKSEPVSHRLVLIGDAGEPYVTGDPIGRVLRRWAAETGRQTTILFLGDNVYPRGLQFEGERLRKISEDVLMNQTGWIRDLPATTYFIPGNHDWHHWGRQGFRYIINQQAWLDSLKYENIRLLPSGGCPGPVEIPLDDHNVLAIIDTQWFLHQWEKPGADGGCEATTPADVITQLEDIFVRNRDKRVIIAAHHPLITYGEHGGVFPIQAHIFPLAELTHHLYLPLPVVGSLYPLYRKWFGHIQDTSHPSYREFADPIAKIMAGFPGSVYVAGHEHALEYIRKDSSHFIVTGSGAKTEFVRKKGKAVFAEAARGFAVLDLGTNEEAILRFVRVDEKHPDGTVVFSTSLGMPGRNLVPATVPAGHAGDSVTTNASSQYFAGRVRRFFLGGNYRDTWAQPIRVPVFHINSEKGGLRVIQRGGGMQTISLRLEDSAGHEYVLRSVEKFPEHAVPEMLRKTFAQDLVQDQISASHPYGAIVIPALARAAGIYHTNPRVVYVPDDPRFGEYRNLLAGKLALFEERPSGDWSTAPNFGNSRKIVNTNKVLEELARDNDNTVDQHFVLKSRLFDLVIGDWDRHDDQWRWASFEDKKGKIFRPVPRDRDQAFFVNEGIIPRLVSRKWAMPKFEGFDSDIDWPSGLSFNARYFDRTFLSALNRDDWRQAAASLKLSLADSAIATAVGKWPAEIFRLDGKTVIDALKKRRDNIGKYAESHYAFLSREVEVAGSDKRELFRIERIDNGDVEVNIFKLGKDGGAGKIIYSRLFRRAETREVRLYGLGGDDRFVIKGGGTRSIKIRVVGGDGYDTLIDDTRRANGGRRTPFYDQKGQGTFTGSNVVDRTSRSAEVNVYNRKAFEYDRLAPLIIGQYNFDDGVFAGGGFLLVTHGFRKSPFRSRHIFLASAAPLTLSYNFRYLARFTEALGKWDIQTELDVKSPNYVNNFFGLGNETEFNRNIDTEPGVDVHHAIDYYRYRFQDALGNVSLSRKVSNWGTISFGPVIRRIRVDRPENAGSRYISVFASSVSEDLFAEAQTFAGVSWSTGIDKRDHRIFTNRGMLLNVTGSTMTNLDDGEEQFSSFEGSLSLYHRFHVPRRLVLAWRVGGGLTSGSFPFYQSQILDGKSELRGYRKTRFYGDSKLYNNTELRLTLKSFRSYLFPATFGINVFHDLGRVWYKDKEGNDSSADDGNSRVWHSGWGGGVWFTPFNAAVVSAEAGHSREGTLLYVRLGFLF